MPPSIIITTIFPPNDVMREIASGCAKRGWDFIIAGDSKSPSDFRLDGATFLDIGSQRAMGEYGRLCPERTYARKNLAYLEAARRGAPFIIETDDDNMPGEGFWREPQREVAGRTVDSPGWVNAYKFFADRFIYPRGFPIDLALPDWQDALSISASQPSSFSISESQRLSISTSPIQQGLADDNPDVDAVWRMLHPLPLKFRQDDPVVLGAGCWCPFNSQNTVFLPEAYPLLYLPATCSFRMTDIWRSFIAQRILWSCGWRLSFHAATVCQERNEHDLLRDFEDEISGYLGNKRIVSLLDSLDLAPGPDTIPANLGRCYAALTREGFFRPEEEALLAAWLDDLPSTPIAHNQ